MTKDIDVATGTVRLQGVGRQRAVEARELHVGDTLMWNFGATSEVTAIVDASPKFLRITEKSKRTGQETERRLMKSRLVARVGRAVSPAQDTAAKPQTLAERFPVDSAAVYVPNHAEPYRDVVIVKSQPDADGKVTAISGRYNGKTIRVPLASLEPLPQLPPAPEGEPTNWWTVTDKDSQQVTIVQAETLEGARDEVEKDPQTAAVAKRLGGLFYRRFRTCELPPKIRAALEAEAAGHMDWWSVKDRQGNAVTQVKATSYDHAVQVADEDPKVRAASVGAGGLVFMRLASIETPPEGRRSPPALEQPCTARLRRPLRHCRQLRRQARNGHPVGPGHRPRAARLLARRAHGA